MNIPCTYEISEGEQVVFTCTTDEALMDFIINKKWAYGNMTREEAENYANEVCDMLLVTGVISISSTHANYTIKLKDSAALAACSHKNSYLNKITTSLQFYVCKDCKEQITKEEFDKAHQTIPY